MSEPRAFVRNASSEKQVRAAKETTRQKMEREDNDLRVVLSTYAGRSFLYRALEECGVYRLSFSQDSHQTAFHEGERNRGLWLLAEITRVDPESYRMMQYEAEKRQANVVEPKARTDDPLEDVDDGN